MEIKLYSNPNDPGVCWIKPYGFEYICDDEWGYPIYEELPPYIGFNPEHIIEYAQNLGINPFQYLYFSILHELGHLIQGEYDENIENEFMAWKYARMIDPTIPGSIILTALCSYM